MNPNQNKPSEQPVIYMQNGERKAISEDQALYMLDSIAQQDISRALQHYQKLCDANPYAQRLLRAFYQSLLDFYRFEELLKTTTRRLTLIPNCHVSFSYRIDALKNMFRYEEVIETIKNVVEHNPSDPITRNLLGQYYKNVGQFEESKNRFDEAIRLNPDFAPPYWNRAEFSSNPKQDLQAVQNAIASGNVAEDQSHYLHFAAYSLAEKLELFDQAFEHLQIANGIQRRTFDFDIQQEIQVDQIAKEIFTQAYVDRFRPQSNNQLRPIFIMGMPGCSTTLVEQIFANHSEVTDSEAHTALANAITRVQRMSDFQGPVNEWLATRQDDDWQKVGNTYAQNMRFTRGDKEVFIDKHKLNYRSIGVIKAALPKAKIIVVDRDPMDAAFACYRQLFSDQNTRFSYQFDEIAKMHASYVSLINHWDEITVDLIKRFKYEDLVCEPEATINEMLAFCELEQEPACFKFYETQRTAKKSGATQSSQPVFTTEIDHWKTYARQLEPLRIELEKTHS